MRPIASDDVAAAIVDVALAEPLNSTIENWLVPNRSVRRAVSAIPGAPGDPRTVITDPKAVFFGTAINDQSLTLAKILASVPHASAEWLVRLREITSVHRYAPREVVSDRKRPTSEWK